MEILMGCCSCIIGQFCVTWALYECCTRNVSDTSGMQCIAPRLAWPFVIYNIIVAYCMISDKLALLTRPTPIQAHTAALYQRPCFRVVTTAASIGCPLLHKESSPHPFTSPQRRARPTLPGYATWHLCCARNVYSA